MTYEHYIAHEDVAFNSWLDARRDRLTGYMGPEAVRDLLRSAFLSGARFGREYRPWRPMSPRGRTAALDGEVDLKSDAHTEGGSV